MMVGERMVGSPSAHVEQTLAFGPFQLLPARKRLLEGGKSIRLGSRALDILIALAERAGELVSKDELVAFAWPSTYVDEANLRVHVAALRKVLGDGQGGVHYIVNVPGQGYRFAAPVTRRVVQYGDALDPGLGVSRSNLPALLVRIIGRSDTVSMLARQLTRQRLVTIVGPGGF